MAYTVRRLGMANSAVLNNAQFLERPVKEPLRENERHRLRTLYDHHILDTPPEDRFDRIVTRAAVHFNVPIATFTLVDETRLWFKSRIGLDFSEIDRSNSFCAHTVANNAPLVIEDSFKDKRFCESAFVRGPPFIRFYAGVPVRARDDEPLGSLCIIDSAPRLLSLQGYELLQTLAHQIEVQLLLRKSFVTTH